jgi:hypothetical protein
MPLHYPSLYIDIFYAVARRPELLTMVEFFLRHVWIGTEANWAANPLAKVPSSFLGNKTVETLSYHSCLCIADFEIVQNRITKSSLCFHTVIRHRNNLTLTYMQGSHVFAVYWRDLLTAFVWHCSVSLQVLQCNLEFPVRCGHRIKLHSVTENPMLPS